MSITAKDLVGKSRNDVNEAALKKQLRQLPEAERFAFIQECLSYRQVVLALVVAKACLQSKKYISQLLEQGLQTADASSIRIWLEFAVTKLGGRSVVQIIASKIESNSDGVAKALYWLPSLLSRNEPKTVTAYQELVSWANKRGIIRQPKTTPHPDDPDRVLFGNIWEANET